MRIGLDLDNTLVCYDRVFPAIAQRLDLLPSSFVGNKQDVRESIRQTPAGEEGWMRLQGQVYGRYMSAADMFPGAAEFLSLTKTHEVYIVSHKTQFGHFDEERYDLRKAALRWLKDHHFFNENIFALAHDNVFFADTLDDKIAKITELNLDLFIDDLDKVFDHPNFPTSTEKLHFAPNQFETWADLTRHVFPHATSKPSAQVIAQKLCNTPNVTVDEAISGGNNTVLQIMGTEPPQALKLYNTNPLDMRDRLSVERTALQYLSDQGERHVPKFYASHTDHRAAIISWIDGETITTPTDDDLFQAIAFVMRLNEYSKLTNSDTLPNASEACLSQSTLVEQVETRLNRLADVACLHSSLEAFLNDHLLPRFTELRNQLPGNTTLPATEQILSPSDFGFHNALRQDDGTVIFIDMEYFGWDDPVKLLSDFILHPGMNVSNEHKRIFTKAIGALFNTQSGFTERLKNHYPLYALRWCAIILNPFVPRLQDGSPPTAEFLDVRLTRAQALYDTVFKIHGEFPYDI
ncbi:MAG: hypothetical protein OQK24_09840 [Magnetovibrio sp.]|nr:hypothetical protein [Magnetovibrio sp.]